MTIYTIEAHPTVYKGFEYRSKLEAQFASFFVHLEIDFLYEPQVFALGNVYYLPDFKLFMPDNTIRWIEAKGPSIYKEAALKCYRLAQETGEVAQLFCGSWGRQTIHSFVPYGKGHKKRVWFGSHTLLDRAWFELFGKDRLNQAILAAYGLD